MGGVCGRPSAIEDSPKEKLPRTLTKAKGKGSSHAPLKLNSSARDPDEELWLQGRVTVADAKPAFIDKKSNASSKRSYDDRNIETHKLEVNHLADRVVPHAIDGELLAAGWPLWLVEAAPEALKGWLPRRADTFEKLDKIGQGTYSNVYKARDIVDGKFVALKRVRFDNLDSESIKFMAREIIILRRLDHPNIIKLKGLITSRKSCNLYLVFEYMEHDLTGLSSLPGFTFTEPQIKCYMHQLLSGLDYCHSHGILHRDIKGSNLLIDNNGILKIADFGLASFFDPHHQYPMTSRVVTLWYRPLELLLGATKYGVGVDLWSAGCILGELYAGRPIMPGRTEVEQLHKIFKLCGSPSEELWRKSKLPNATAFKPREPYKRCIAETFNDFPDVALQLMEILLSLDPKHRGTAARALKSEYFTSEPLPCDPSSLPVYPPSKEMDAKLREEDARRLKGAGSKGQKPDLGRSRQKDSQAVAAPNANAESVMVMQKRRDSSSSKSRSETFNPWKDEAVSGFSLGEHRQAQPENSASKDTLDHHSRYSYSGPLVAGVGQVKAGKKLEESSRTDLSKLSGLVAIRTSNPSYVDDQRDKSKSSQSKVKNHPGRFSGALDEWESAVNQDQKRHSQRIPVACQEEGITQTRDSMNDSKIAFSGPLVSSHKVDQMLKDHDRQVQEYARRTRQERIKHMKLLAKGK
uniref:Protein kinase domain-containing protein n=1 Tax=Kalanchoe fedtschenkoi TaxID=63787 RepID=A0A7N0ULN0_KALFE